MNKAYSINLTLDQWQLLEPLIPAAKPGDRPRSQPLPVQNIISIDQKAVFITLSQIAAIALQACLLRRKR